jgi:MarR family transcriptional regulator, organic hydroperoxide resistance regulator
MSAEITQSVGFALAQLCKAHRYAVDVALREHQLRVGQEMLLIHLWANDGIPQTQIVEAMRVEPPTVTKMLQRMESEGLVERRPDPEDARLSRVFLTSRSRALRADVEAAWRSVEEVATAGLSHEERLLLRRLLVQMRQNLAGRE